MEGGRGPPDVHTRFIPHTLHSNFPNLSPPSSTSTVEFLELHGNGRIGSIPVTSGSEMVWIDFSTKGMSLGGSSKSMQRETLEQNMALPFFYKFQWSGCE